MRRVDIVVEITVGGDYRAQIFYDRRRPRAVGYGATRSKAVADLGRNEARRKK